MSKKALHIGNTLKDSQRAETQVFLPFLYAIKILFFISQRKNLPHPSLQQSH